MKKAIIAASFGTLCEDAVKKSIEPTESEIRCEFPEYTVLRAFTSERIAASLSEQGIYTDTLGTALEKVSAQGYDEVIIQPQLIIGGIEYEKIRAAAGRYKDSFASLKIGVPLLNSREDAKRICNIFAEEFCKKCDAVVLMGHGTEHEADGKYGEFNEVCKSLGYGNIFVVTARGALSAGGIIPELQKSGFRDIILAPLLITAGVHARRDMVSDKPDSIKSVLEAGGFSVRADIRGLGEYPQVRRIFLEHLRYVVGNF